MPGPILFTYSDRPDPKILSFLAKLQSGLLLLVALIATPVLCGWVWPGLGLYLPPGWNSMKANTALLILIGCLSLMLSGSTRSSRAVRIGGALGLLVTVLAAITFAQFFGLEWLPIDTMLARDPSGIVPGRMSLQATVVFMLMGLVLAGIRARKSVLARLVDLGTLLLGIFMLSFVGALFLEQGALAGRSLRLQLAAQSFVCLGLLTLLIFNRRAEYGLFSILIDAGAGGKTARLAAPVALVLPFTIQSMQQAVIHHHLLSVNYALAFVPALMSILVFCLILTLARRSQELENATRELSLRDELTQLYNRRGFLALAGQSLRNATRSRQEFSVLFLDVDDLKRVNDELGHDVGSDLLRVVAGLLRQTFRDSDVLGRLGGDEFVVATNASAAQMQLAIDRLEQALEAENATLGRNFQVGLSLGCVTRGDKDESLEDLIERADERMYEAKRKKKSRLAQPVS